MLKTVNFFDSQHFSYIKKIAVISNCCLIGNIRHNFLVPRMIELACKTFMPIQTLFLHRVERTSRETINCKLKCDFKKSYETNVLRAAAQIQDSRLLNVCEAWYILHGERREMVLTASFDLTCVCVYDSIMPI